MRLQKLLIKENFDIRNLTSFKIGGNVSKIYFPETIEEFEKILKREPSAFVAGNLSNTLISSRGYEGVVISTTKLDYISISGNIITAGAGVKGPKLAQFALEHSLSGMEFMIGFPGSVGGEVYMNAGAHEQCISDIFKSAKIFDGENVITLKDMDFGYRTSICQKNNYIILEAEFELKKSDKSQIKSKMDENLEFRKTYQPLLTLPNCGSIFKNPENNSAGKLLDECKVKGLKIGGAKVWESHANFIINEDNATSDDVLKLMKEMQNRVLEKFNIKLKPEIRFLGSEELWETIK